VLRNRQQKHTANPLAASRKKANMTDNFFIIFVVDNHKKYHYEKLF